MKQETLEEAAENYAGRQSDISMRKDPLEFSKSGQELWEEAKEDFKAGAKWQQERMYSEEDVLNFAKYILSKEVTIARSPSDVSSYLPKEFQLLSGELEHNGKKLLKEWFEQFKKK
jgi:hypothetical protein